MFHKPDNVITGTAQGFKSGAIEIARGFSGIFTKPYQGAKEDGVAGLFKGMGKGLLGAVTSPVTAALKIGTSLIQGIEGTVVTIGKGGTSHRGRIRFPRYITPRNVLVMYDESLSEAKLIINILFHEKYAAEDILLFEVLKTKSGQKEPMIIITEKRLLVLSHEKRVLNKTLHSNIEYAQLYPLDDQGRYVAQIVLKNGKPFTINSINYQLMSICMSFLPENLPMHPKRETKKK